MNQKPKIAADEPSTKVIRVGTVTCPALGRQLGFD